MTDAVLPRLPFLPFMPEVARRAPGLSPLPDAEWLAGGADAEAQLALRAALIAERREDVIACLAEGLDPATELREILAGHIGRSVRLDDDPLREVGRWVCEDFCLLQRLAEEDEYRLVGAILCFPSHWVLAEKIGRPMTEIHAPVPEYEDDLARRVNRVFHGIRVGQMMVRHNWVLHSDPTFFAPHASAKPGGALYLRTERQTLRRLPRTGAVAFGIRTSVAPVDGLTGEEATALWDAMDARSAETVAYKGGAEFYDWARRVVATLAQ